MSSLGSSGKTSFIGASVRSRPAAADSPRPRVLDRIGKSIVERAVRRVSIGAITVHDAATGEVVRSPSAGGDRPGVTLRVNDPSFYGAAAFGGGVGISESYIRGEWGTDDLAGLIEVITRNLTALDSLEGPLARVLTPLSRVAYWLERNTRRGSRQNIVAHYDLGNDFFRLFLDRTMTYSSGIFENGATTLEEAQIEKIDRVCRKLDLQPSDHLLEIGSGWGAMAIHAASRYGCRVTTTTISDEQHSETTRRVREAGLDERIEVLKRDYRDLEGLYDKLVSIEMIEAVGAENYDTYFNACSRLLKPQGAALIQAIVIRDQFFKRAARRRDFLKKYIFPGSCLPSVASMLDAIRRSSDLRTWHMEDIGPHYVTTLRLWDEAFQARLDEVQAMGFDDRFIRMWTYYFAYCEGAFRARHVGDVQLLLTKPQSDLGPVGERATSAT